MAKLKLSAIADDKPVRLSVESVRDDFTATLSPTVKCSLARLAKARLSPQS